MAPRTKQSRFFIFYIFFALSAFFLFSAAWGAQLRSGTDATPVRIDPEIYIIEDTGKELSATEIYHRYQNNLRGMRQNGNIIMPALDSGPFWLVLSVHNSSNTEDWLLDMGGAFNGRLGFTKKAELYHYAQNGLLLNRQNFQGPAAPVKLAMGESHILAIYLEPAGALPFSLAPKFIEETHYITVLTGGKFGAVFFQILFFGLAGFFAAFGFIRKNPAYLLFSGYYLLHVILLALFETVFVAQSGWAGATAFLLLGLSGLCAPLSAKFFLGVSVEQYRANMALAGSGLALVLILPLSYFLKQNSGPFDEFLLYISLSLCWLTAAAISLFQNHSENPAGYQFTIAWLLSFFGSLPLVLSYAGVLPVNVYIMNAYWLALLPQAVLLAFCARERIAMHEEEKQHLRSREDRTVKSLARLRHSKESVNQARLLRVIDRERELMAELREREILRTKEMRIAKEAADEANRAKSAFLAVVSHEIRTPMTGILGMVRLLGDTALNKEQSEYLMAVRQSGETMLALLNDILDFEKIERGGMELEIVDFDLPGLIDGVVKLMSGQAAEKNLDLKAEIDPACPRWVKGDPTRLRQILLNLVGNALKFTEEGGVTIHLKPIERKKAQDHILYFAVEDTGIGISKKAQENLFNPFEQANPGITRKYGGTGLGLAICKRLVETMGGTIRLDSTPGEGSTFSFELTLPKGRKTEDTDKKDKAPLQPDERWTVLVVEDNEINRGVLKAFLEKAGHTVSLETAAEPALENFQKNDFDLVLTDINLKDMDGFAFLEAIRAQQDQAKAAIPVVAVTGQVSQDDTEKFQKAGFNAHIPKPVDPEMLEQVFQKIKTARPAKTKKGTPHIKDILENKQREPDSFSAPDSPPNISSKDFDEDMLKNLLETLGREEFLALLKGFFAKTEDIVETMQDLQKNADLESLRDRAHELRGMAANFGMNNLSRAAAYIEKKAAEGEMQKASDKMKTLPALSKKCRKKLEKWVADMAGNP